MRKQQTTTIDNFPLPDTMSTEIQVIADLISVPESMMEASRILTPDMFNDDKCRDAFLALKRMTDERMVIDLPSVWGRIDADLIQKGVIPMMINTGGALTVLQHYASLKDFYIKRRCYFKAMELLMSSTDTSVSSADLIMKTGQFAESLREEMDTEKDTQHISEVLNELGAEVEERQRLKAEGKALRVPTGIYSLDYLTYGGFNAGNLVILAARPSVGKTAVMLQMAMAAAKAGKSVNLYNLEMTNTELAQRMLFATGRLTPLQMARGEVEWKEFELASGEYASRPLYLNDSVSTAEEIISRISLNAQRGKCDIAFIDYLGLIQMSSRLQLKEAIAEVTKRLKNVAKEYRIPIVLLCQLNRASASENRPPMMHDLRDSGAIEQDADIILMLERSAENEGEINMWVRKNRQGKAGDVKVELKANDTFTAFADKNEPVYEPPPMPDYDFEINNQEFPF